MIDRPGDGSVEQNLADLDALGEQMRRMAVEAAGFARAMESFAVVAQELLDAVDTVLSVIPEDEWEGLGGDDDGD